MAVERQVRAHGRPDSGLFDTGYELVRLLVMADRYAEAEPLFIERISMLEAELGEGHPYTLRVVGRLVEFYDAWGKPDKAAEWRAKLAESQETE